MTDNSKVARSVTNSDTSPETSKDSTRLSAGSRSGSTYSEEHEEAGFAVASALKQSIKTLEMFTQNGKNDALDVTDRGAEYTLLESDKTNHMNRRSKKCTDKKQWRVDMVKKGRSLGTHGEDSSSTSTSTSTSIIRRAGIHDLHDNYPLLDSSSSAFSTFSSTSSSSAAAISRASASILSAGATLQSLQTQLKILRQEGNRTISLRHTSAAMMCDHDVELHHLHQLEREEMHASEDALRNNVVDALNTHQLALEAATVAREEAERTLLEELNLWKQRQAEALARRESRERQLEEERQRRIRESEECAANALLAQLQQRVAETTAAIQLTADTARESLTREEPIQQSLSCGPQAATNLSVDKSVQVTLPLGEKTAEAHQNSDEDDEKTRQPSPIPDFPVEVNNPKRGVTIRSVCSTETVTASPLDSTTTSSRATSNTYDSSSLFSLVDHCHRCKQHSTRCTYATGKKSCYCIRRSRSPPPRHCVCYHDNNHRCHQTCACRCGHHFMPTSPAPFSSPTMPCCSCSCSCPRTWPPAHVAPSSHCCCTCHVHPQAPTAPARPLPQGGYTTYIGSPQERGIFSLDPSPVPPTPPPPPPPPFPSPSEATFLGTERVPASQPKGPAVSPADRVGQKTLSAAREVSPPDGAEAETAAAPLTSSSSSLSSSTSSGSATELSHSVHRHRSHTNNNSSVHSSKVTSNSGYVCKEMNSVEEGRREGDLTSGPNVSNGKPSSRPHTITTATTASNLSPATTSTADAPPPDAPRRLRRQTFSPAAAAAASHRAMPPFLPSGPLGSPEAPRRCRSHSEGAMPGRPSSPPPSRAVARAGAGHGLPSHHVSALLSTVVRQNRLRPRAYYHRVGGHEPIDVTDTEYRRRKLLAKNGNSRAHSPGVSAAEEEEERWEAEAQSLHTYGSRRTYQSKRCTSCAPTHPSSRAPSKKRTANVNAQSNEGRHLSPKNLRQAEERRKKVLRGVLSEVQKEQRYCDALYDDILHLVRGEPPVVVRQ